MKKDCDFALIRLNLFDEYYGLLFIYKVEIRISICYSCCNTFFALYTFRSNCHTSGILQVRLKVSDKWDILCTSNVLSDELRNRASENREGEN